MKALLTVVVVGAAALAGHLATVSTPTIVAETVVSDVVKVDQEPASSPGGLVVHEWGTFTSFSGSNGVPATFRSDNTDLPSFVYRHEGDTSSKAIILNRWGTVSMETPVIYFYTDKETQATVKVDFPSGWITDWYPYAVTKPLQSPKRPGETISWNVRVQPGVPARFAREKGDHPYYHARETDAAPLQTVFDPPEHHQNDSIHGGSIAQSEKLLFYRGVGTFPLPVTVKSVGGGKVRVVNAAGGKATGLVLVAVHSGELAFKTLDDLDNGAEAVATLPEGKATAADLGRVLEKSLIAAGLYEREASAMVKTWDHAWFKQEGTRLLYVLPRSKTDELLPLAITPQPKEIARVIVGRHDFLTIEQEAIADQQVARIRAAQAELNAAQAELSKIGRFSEQATQAAAGRLDATKK